VPQLAVSNKNRNHKGKTVRTHLRKTRVSDRSDILMFDKGVGLDPRNRRRRHAQSQVIEAERMLAIGRMACSISHDMRHSLTAIYANAEFLERHDLGASARADLLLEIQEAVLAMAERIDSLLQFGSGGRKNPLVHERVSLVVEKAVAAVKFHPDGQNVSITVSTFPPAALPPCSSAIRRARVSPRPVPLGFPAVTKGSNNVLWTEAGISASKNRIERGRNSR
jgi:C4-dicarboxylate-specific signal transduction histidine kinase